MKASRVQALILLWIAYSLSECKAYGQGPRDESHKITVATVQPKAVTITQQYVCQVRSHHHIEVRAPAEGFIAASPIHEGQSVQRDNLLFRVGPLLGKENPGNGNESGTIAIKAPFCGLVGRLLRQQGSLVRKGETLTTLSDNSLMWVYFNVPEVRYLEYMADQGQNKPSEDVELLLADQSKFPQTGKIGSIETVFNKETGTIAFRADFPNPTGLLHHGQTGTLLINRVLKDAIVIPQRATFEKLARRYVYVVDNGNVAHQREIVVQNELDDLFVLKTGVAVGDKIVVDGIRRVRDGEKVESEDRPPETTVGNRSR